MLRDTPPPTFGTRNLRTAIPGNAELLADNPTLARSIRNRFPYLDPLNHLQLELLRRHRAGSDNERVKNGIELDEIIGGFIKARDLTPNLKFFDEAGNRFSVVHLLLEIFYNVLFVSIVFHVVEWWQGLWNLEQEHM